MSKPKGSSAKIDFVKAVAGVSFTTLAAIGGSTGNPLIAGLSSLPSAGLASYHALGNQRLKFTQKEKYLELPSPAWWPSDTRSWQNLCAEIGNRLPDIFEAMNERMQQEQQVMTWEVIRQIFIEVLTAQHLTWEPDSEQRRLVAEFVATPILQKLEDVLRPVVEQIQHEGSLKDERKTALNTEQAVQVLEKIHEEISNTTRSPALQDDEISALRRQYSHTLYQRFRMLDFKGIMHVDMNRPISIPLLDVFVFPDVLIGVPEHETLEREGEHFLYTNRSQQKPKRVTPQRETFQTALMKHRRLVLLGDPGSGKSTLLRYLLLQLVQGSDAFAATFPHVTDMAPAVPLYIPLAAYAETVLANAPGTRSIEDFLPVYLRDYYLGAYVNFVQDQLERGNLVLLLDGLDEIPDATLRMNVVRHIEMFTQAHTANRFIVTSRIVGYKEAPLSSDYQAYTLADFNEEQVKAFAQRWCPAYEYWVNETRENQYLEEAATKEAEKLFAATQSKPGVKRLAVNPLLLTILSLIQRQGIELPSHRVELFELCTTTLIDTWVKAKGQSIRFSRNDLIKILRPLAFWMHNHPAVGAIPDDELREQIVRQLVERTISEFEAANIAEQFLQTVRGRTGILVERGKDRYGFLHLSFEEYFAALELEKRKDRSAFIRAHLHDPRWREVILLTVGVTGILHSDEEEVTDLVQHIIAQAGSAYESSLHRDLLFAGLCLADDVGVRVACEREIVEEIVYLFLTNPYDEFRKECSTLFAEWKGTRVADRAADLVLPLLRHWLTSINTLSTPTAISPFEQRVAAQIDRLMIQFQDTTMPRVRFHLNAILVPLGVCNQLDWMESLLEMLTEESVRESVTEILRDHKSGPLPIVEILLIALSDPNEEVKAQILRVLGFLGDAQPAVIDALLSALSYSLPVQHAAAQALQHLGLKQPRITDALLSALIESPLANEATISALWQLGEKQPNVVNVMLTYLVSVDELLTREAAAKVLELLNGAEGSTIDALLAAISNPDREAIDVLVGLLNQLTGNSAIVETLRLSFAHPAPTREAAVRVLGYVGKDHPQVIDGLLTVLAAPRADLRATAVSALGHLKMAHPSVISALLSTLTSASWVVRSEGARALMELREDQPQIIDSLLACLSDRDPDVREAAVRALASLAGKQTRVIEALLAALFDGQENVAAAAFEALGKLSREYPDLTDYLLATLAAKSEHSLLQQALGEQRLRLYEELADRGLILLRDVESNQPHICEMLFTIFSHSFLRHRMLAAQALGQLAKKQPGLVDRLLSLLTHEDGGIRSVAISALGQLDKGKKDVLEAVISALNDRSSIVRSNAASALGHLGKGEPLAIEAVLLALSDDHEEVRMSAARALRILDEKQPRVIDALLTALSDPSGRVRQTAALALADLDDGQPHVIDALLQTLFISSWFGRNGAIYGLSKLGKGKSYIIDALLAALSGADLSVRSIALRTLGMLDDTHPRITNALFAALNDPSYVIRASAAEALGQLGEKRPECIAALLLRLSDPAPQVRAAAARAFSDLYDGDPTVVSALIQASADSSWGVREAAAVSLATSPKEREMIGAQIENLLREYEPVENRRMRGINLLFRSLQKIAEVG